MPSENMLLSSLPRERDRLSEFLDTVEVGFEEVLIEPNQRIDYIWFPNDAVLSTLHVLRNGASVEAGVIGLEGMVGLAVWLHQRCTPTRTLVQVPGTSVRMRTADFVLEVLETQSPLNILIARYIHG